MFFKCPEILWFRISAFAKESESNLGLSRRRSSTDSFPSTLLHGVKLQEAKLLDHHLARLRIVPDDSPIRYCRPFAFESL